MDSANAGTGNCNIGSHWKAKEMSTNSLWCVFTTESTIKCELLIFRFDSISCLLGTNLTYMINKYIYD